MKKPQDAIKELIRLGFSQKEISDHTFIPTSTISRILNSQKPNPRWETVEALNSFLETINKFEDESL
ncbi:helix-turn-helix transcriptional regulator [Orbaceae bacterium ESL0721]|nr:helix-turn-helix transcriptional regulator [Orbaceae bacterium ESL0721]